MWLVLCAADDLSALWAARGLAARGLQPTEIVTADMLAYNLRFEHRLSAGEPSVNITLADQRVINSGAIRGTLNRLQLLPSAHLRGAAAADRDYAVQELYALTLSWLYGLPGIMLNRPTPQGLSGEWRHRSEWLLLATQAGLTTMPYQQSDLCGPAGPSALPATQSLIMVRGICCGPTVPPSIAAGCARLASFSGTDLLGIEFLAARRGDWIFTNATPLPDLRSGGSSLLDALADALRS